MSEFWSCGIDERRSTVNVTSSNILFHWDLCWQEVDEALRYAPSEPRPQAYLRRRGAFRAPHLIVSFDDPAHDNKDFIDQWLDVFTPRCPVVLNYSSGWWS